MTCLEGRSFTIKLYPRSLFLLHMCVFYAYGAIEISQ